MRRLFYKWLYKRFYNRVLAVAKEAREKIDGDMQISYIRLFNLMEDLKDELTGGSS